MYIFEQNKDWIKKLGDILSYHIPKAAKLENIGLYAKI